MQSSHYRNQIQRVNRRMAAARFHLSVASQDSITQPQKAACLESCIYQLHFALLHYLDELLLCYQRPVITTQNIDLKSLLNETPKVLEEMTEFDEIKQWCLNHPINLYGLINFFQGAVLGLPTLESLQELQITDASLIAITKDDKALLFNISQLTKVLNELQTLIETQRQNQIEY